MNERKAAFMRLKKTAPLRVEPLQHVGIDTQVYGEFAGRRLRERAHRGADLGRSIVEIRPVLRLGDRSERSSKVVQRPAHLHLV